MDVIGLVPEEQNFLFRTLAATLHLGNLRFSKAGDGSRVQNRDGIPPPPPTLSTPTYISFSTELNICAELLRHDPDALERALTIRTVSAGSGGGSNTVSVPLDEPTVWVPLTLPRKLF